MPFPHFSEVFPYYYDTAQLKLKLLHYVVLPMLKRDQGTIPRLRVKFWQCCSASHEERLWDRQEAMWERELKRWDAERALWTMREQQMQQQICDLQALVVSGSCLTRSRTDSVLRMVCLTAVHDQPRGTLLYGNAISSRLRFHCHVRCSLVMGVSHQKPIF